MHAKGPTAVGDLYPCRYNGTSFRLHCILELLLPCLEVIGLVTFFPLFFPVASERIAFNARFFLRQYERVPVDFYNETTATASRLRRDGEAARL